nr:hypothetical protein orf129 [Navicula sp.]WPV72572.1 hypothetical protein orf129 [Navicula sp.]WPV72657.1 hypothetical protein orf129 [Navicula sp.]WPV72730.1 hypothetical protein orf129 [Navicula sp.]
MKKEEIARAVQLAVQDEMTNFSYKVGNATLKALEVKETAETLGSGAAAIQAGYSMGQTAFGAAEDISRGDKLCTGLCLVATGCEGIAFVTRVVKVPYGMKIYVCTKAASAGLMKFRNLCRNAQGQIGPC